VGRRLLLTEALKNLLISLYWVPILAIFRNTGDFFDSNISIVQGIRHVISKRANGFLSKSMSAEEFKEAILQIGDGKQYGKV